MTCIPAISLGVSLMSLLASVGAVLALYFKLGSLSKDMANLHFECRGLREALTTHKDSYAENRFTEFQQNAKEITGLKVTKAAHGQQLVTLFRIVERLDVVTAEEKQQLRVYVSNNKTDVGGVHGDGINNIGDNKINGGQ